jgi:hypothetical protein
MKYLWRDPRALKVSLVAILFCSSRKGRRPFQHMILAICRQVLMFWL